MKNIVLLICMMMASASLAIAQDISEKLISVGVPEIVLKLAEWPTTDLIEEKQVLSISDKASRSYDWWIEEVFNSKILPKEEKEGLFIKGETEGRDVIRTRWKTDDYEIEVSQTYSVFVTKVRFNKTIGKQMSSICRLALLDILTSEKRGERTVMREWRPSEIANIAVWLTFKYQTDITISDEREIWGAQLISPEKNSRSPSYTYDWFEVLGCWCDGNNLIFYFEKPRGGSRTYMRSDFRPLIDKDWFSK